MVFAHCFDVKLTPNSFCMFRIIIGDMIIILLAVRWFYWSSLSSLNFSNEST